MVASKPALSIERVVERTALSKERVLDEAFAHAIAENHSGADAYLWVGRLQGRCRRGPQ